MYKLLGALLTALLATGATAQTETSPRRIDSTQTVTRQVDVTTPLTGGNVLNSRTTTTTTDTRVMGNTGVRTTTIERAPVAPVPTRACSPGLAKKNNGCLPPGRAKKLPRD